MYNDYSYEEYIRNSLGYNLNPDINDNEIYYEDDLSYIENNQEIENMYPDIYKIVYPIVCKKCMNFRGSISEELVNKITDDILVDIEGFEITKEQVRSNIISNKNDRNNCSSCAIKDLIKILVLRELIGNPIRPGKNPFRPPVKPPIGPRPHIPYRM